MLPPPSIAPPPPLPNTRWLTLQNMVWVLARPSRRMGNLTSQLPTMFWTLNSCAPSMSGCGAGEGSSEERRRQGAGHSTSRQPPAQPHTGNRPAVSGNHSALHRTPCAQRTPRWHHRRAPHAPTARTLNDTWYDSFCRILAYLRAAVRASCSLLVPVQTILPEWKMRAVDLGSRMRMMTCTCGCACAHVSMYESVCVRACQARAAQAHQGTPRHTHAPPQSAWGCTRRCGRAAQCSSGPACTPG